MGGSGKLIYSDDVGSRWTFAVESRFGDLATKRVYVNVNRHFEHPDMPSACGLGKALEELWDIVHQFVMDFEILEGDARV